jgi:ATP-dependent exoDNAse (exonuclease V) beta subunit
MSRPMKATASTRDHADRGDREGADWGHREGVPSGGEGADGRAIGIAIHQALEEFDFSADEEAEILRQRDALARNLAQLAAGDGADDAIIAGAQLWDRVVRGRLFARLRELSDRIIARELSVLGPPIDEDGPVGYLTGTVDLVYRDPSNERLVVVDYKADSLLPSESIQSRADTYAEQGSAYRHALQDALELSYTPRFELWFLRADEIVRY